MSLIAPIGPARVAGIQPAAPGPDSDPSEDGLGVQLVMEPAPMGVIDDGEAVRRATSTDASIANWRNPITAAAATQRASLAQLPTSAQAFAPAGGSNARISTGFDRTPAMAESSARPQLANASPVARAYAAWSS